MPDKKHERILEEFKASGQEFKHETIMTGDGRQLTVLFFKHASLGFIWDGYVAYVDPLTEYADYSRLPKAELVLVTHEHYDHLDKAAIDAAADEKTVIIGSREAAKEYSKALPMSPGDRKQVKPDVTVEAVPAYNVSEGQLQFHPKERGDNGYVLSLGGTRIYIPGDTEPIPEMAGLGKIDIMFLPVNQPYTMKPEQAAQAARTIGAPIFYPYHTGDTDLKRLQELLGDTPSISVRVYPME